jgi:hypothetical protein
MLWSPVVGLPADGQPGASTTNEVFVAGFYMDRSPNYYSYWIDFDRLPGKVSWHEGKEPFPVTLSSEVSRAGEWLTQRKHLTNDLELLSIQIRRTFCSLPRAFGPGEPRATTNAWLVDYEFYENPHAPIFLEHHHVLMLLDGTYATERARQKTSRERNTAPEGSPSASLGRLGGGSNGLQPSRRVPRTENPFEIVRRAEFQIPGVQWNPSSPFPLELGALEAHAHRILMETSGMPEAFVLQELSIDHYWPNGAVPDILTQLQSHHWHWMVWCKYAEKPGHWPSGEYCIYFLLDGRVLSVTTPDKTAPTALPDGTSSDASTVPTD